eukprot:GHVN01014445.1.p2 GENE.GHVN01014445.1~~GHVN01014445.1.p2  ORF type:complete len:160 (+),score=16.52 GHVN01014445.1:975-1454(+)
MCKELHRRLGELQLWKQPGNRSHQGKTAPESLGAQGKGGVLQEAGHSSSVKSVLSFQEKTSHDHQPHPHPLLRREAKGLSLSHGLLHPHLLLPRSPGDYLPILQRIQNAKPSAAMMVMQPATQPRSRYLGSNGARKENPLTCFVIGRSFDRHAGAIDRE